jgi:fucose permease
LLVFVVYLGAAWAVARPFHHRVMNRIGHFLEMVLAIVLFAIAGAILRPFPERR